MNRTIRRLAWAAVLAVPLLLLSTAPARAQFFGGYGMGGLGYGGMGGYGYGGYGGFGGGLGYGGYGGGLGYGGYGGFGYGGFGGGLGGYGYGFGGGPPGYGYAGLGLTPGVYGFPYGSAGFWSTPYLNPLFGMGLTPLGLQSAIGERAFLGRGVSNGRGTSSYPTTIMPSTQAMTPGGFRSIDARPHGAVTTTPVSTYGGPLGTMPSADNLP